MLTQPQPPYAIVWASHSWLVVCGYSSLAEVAGCTLSIVQGARTDHAAVDRIMEAVRYEQSIEGLRLINYDKQRRPFRHTLRVTPVRSRSAHDVRACLSHPPPPACNPCSHAYAAPFRRPQACVPEAASLCARGCNHRVSSQVLAYCTSSCDVCPLHGGSTVPPPVGAAPEEVRTICTICTLSAPSVPSLHHLRPQHPEPPPVPSLRPLRPLRPLHVSVSPAVQQEYWGEEVESYFARWGEVGKALMAQECSRMGQAVPGR